MANYYDLAVGRWQGEGGALEPFRDDAAPDHLRRMCFPESYKCEAVAGEAQNVIAPRPHSSTGVTQPSR
jgi:hypothetical protein